MAYETTFPETHPQLISCTEADNTCKGWNPDLGCLNGQDEVDPGGTCKNCVKDEDAYYTRLAQERDRREAEDGSQYRHLIDEREIPLQAIGKVAA